MCRNRCQRKETTGSIHENDNLKGRHRNIHMHIYLQPIHKYHIYHIHNTQKYVCTHPHVHTLKLNALLGQIVNEEICKFSKKANLHSL